MPDDKHTPQSIIPVSDNAKFKAPHLKLNNLNSNIFCGLSSAAVTATLFQPVDRALFLAAKNDEPVLTLGNFQRPFQGAGPALCQRVLVNGIYYIFQGVLQGNLLPFLQNQWGASELTAHFCLGLVAGAGSGVLTNPFTVAKYYAWEKKDSFFAMAREIWSKEGSKALLKCAHITVSRDLLFAAVYEPSRIVFRQQFNYNSADPSSPGKFSIFAANSAAGGLAMLASTPLQYVRNKKFATPLGEKIPSTKKILGELINGSSFTPLRVSWNVGRVALGTAVNQFVCDVMRKKMAGFTPESAVEEVPRKRLR